MHHEQVAAENLIDRYVRNELSTQDADAFEQHFLGCRECLDDLAAAQRLRAGLKDLVDAGEIQHPDPVSGVPWWRSATWATAATALLTVSLVTSSVLFQRQNKLSSLAASTAQVFPLVAVRSGTNDPPVNELTVNSSTAMLVLMADSGRVNGTGSFAVTLVSESGTTEPIMFEPLEPAADGKLAIAVASGQLRPGDYRIEVREAGAEPVLNEVRFRLAYEK